MSKTTRLWLALRLFVASVLYSWAIKIAPEDSAAWMMGYDVPRPKWMTRR